MAHAHIRVEEGQQPRPFDLRESLGVAQRFHGLFQALIFSQRRLDDAVEFGTAEAAPPLAAGPGRLGWRSDRRAGSRQGAAHRRRLDELRALAVRRRFRAAAEKEKKHGRGRDGQTPACHICSISSWAVSCFSSCAAVRRGGCVARASQTTAASANEYHGAEQKDVVQGQQRRLLLQKAPGLTGRHAGVKPSGSSLSESCVIRSSSEKRLPPNASERSSA